MPVKRRGSKVKQGLSEAARRFLAGRVHHHRGDYDNLGVLEWNELCHLADGGPETEAYGVLPGPWEREVCGMGPAELIERHGDTALREFIAAHPGRRPAWWWDWRGPEELRERIGGVGMEIAEDDGTYSASMGVPASWWTPGDERRYRNRKPWDRWEEPTGPVLDRKDPPMYEAEAAYLDRLGLLVKGERERLTEPDFAPESILDIRGFDDDEL
jgi:hypothetical protein